MQEKLKIAILIDAFEVKKWIYDSIKTVKDLETCEIKLIILNKKTNEIVKRKTKRKISYYKYFRKIDSFFNKKNKSSQFLYELNDLIDKSIPVLEVNPFQKSYKDYFSKSVISQMQQEYNCDIGLRFGFRVLSGQILDVFPFGVLSFHHGDNNKYRGQPSGFWEVYEKNYISSIVLQRLTETLDGGDVIYKAFLRTNMSSTLYNKDELLNISSIIIKKVFSNLQYIKTSNSFNNKTVFDFYYRKLYKVPTLIQILIFLIKYISRKIILKIKSLFLYKQWFILYTENKNFSIYKYKKIIPPKGYYYADPFPVEKDNKKYVFFEERKVSNNKGFISLLEIDKDNVNIIHNILKKDYHLSYPNVFFHNNNIYLLPETTKNRTVELYISNGDLTKWNFKRILLKNVIASDPTIFYYNSKWWLFFSGSDDLNNRYQPDARLYLYYSDSLETEFLPHKNNPIKIDIRSSRPAGKIFINNNKIIRPAQNCAKTYGASIVFNQIIEISENDYKEVEFSYIQPEWDNNLLGCHTFNFSNNIICIDAAKNRFRI